MKKSVVRTVKKARTAVKSAAKATKTKLEPKVAATPTVGTTVVQISKTTHALVKAKAKAKGMTIAGYVERALKSALKTAKVKAKP